MDMEKKHESYYPVMTHTFASSILEEPQVRLFPREAEILIVQSGTVNIQIEKDTLPFIAGQGIFLKQNLPHSLLINPPDDYVIQSLRFRPTFLFGDESQGLNIKYLTPLNLSRDFRYLPLEPGKPEASKTLILAHRIIDADNRKAFAYELEVKSLLLELWRLILLQMDAIAFSQDEMHLSSPDSVRISQAIHFMEEHYGEPITLEDIANSIHLSKSECCRCFRRILGITPFEYLLRFRIHESARMLKSGEASSYTISELAALVGFNSPSYYNKTFRKIMNCTPVEYKKMSKLI